MACCSDRNRAIFLIIYGMIGVVVGVLVGIVFLVLPELSNQHAGSWGFVSAVFAALVSSYGILRLSFWRCLRRVTLLFVVVGATGVMIGSLAFIVYLILGITDTGECTS